MSYTCPLCKKEMFPYFANKDVEIGDIFVCPCLCSGAKVKNDFSPKMISIIEAQRLGNAAAQAAIAAACDKLVQ